MAVEPTFKVHSASHILSLLLLAIANCGVVDCVLLHTTSLQWALVLPMALAVASVFSHHPGFVLEDLLVVRVDDCLHVFAAAIRYLDSVSVEYGVQGVASREMFVDQPQEHCSDVGFD